MASSPRSSRAPSKPAAAARRHKPIVFAHPGGYAHLSTRPLHILVFLLPLVLLYELGSAMYLSGGVVKGHAAQTIRAERLLASFFEWFGVSGLFLPGVVLVVVLLIWHVLNRDKWQVKPAVLGWMYVEAVLWTLPLLVLGQLVYRVVQDSGGFVAAVGLAAQSAPAEAAGTLARLPKPALATISIGAGLYEELLFRMVAIALVHLIAADLLGMRETAAKLVAVGAAALAFVFYHDVTLPGGGMDLPRMAIYLVAGLYFGAVYVLRGFGIVVAVHAFYDLAVLVLLPSR